MLNSTGRRLFLARVDAQSVTSVSHKVRGKRSPQTFEPTASTKRMRNGHKTGLEFAVKPKSELPASVHSQVRYSPSVYFAEISAFATLEPRMGEHLPALVSGFPPSRAASQESSLTLENLPRSVGDKPGMVAEKRKEAQAGDLDAQTRA